MTDLFRRIKRPVLNEWWAMSYTLERFGFGVMWPGDRKTLARILSEDNVDDARRMTVLLRLCGMMQRALAAHGSPASDEICWNDPERMQAITRMELLMDESPSVQWQVSIADHFLCNASTKSTARFEAVSVFRDEFGYLMPCSAQLRMLAIPALVDSP